MKTSLAAALTLALATVSLSAFAGEKGDAKSGQFPMAAADFRAKVAAHAEKRQAKFDKKVAEKKIPADKLEKIRARMIERNQKLAAAVDKAAADGVVTKEEAKEVRQAVGGKRHARGERGQRPAKQLEAAATHDTRPAPRGRARGRLSRAWPFGVPCLRSCASPSRCSARSAAAVAIVKMVFHRRRRHRRRHRALRRPSPRRLLLLSALILPTHRRKRTQPSCPGQRVEATRGGGLPWPRTSGASAATRTKRPSGRARHTNARR